MLALPQNERRQGNDDGHLVDADADLRWLFNTGVRLHEAGAVRLSHGAKQRAKVQAEAFAEGEGDEGKQDGHRGQESAQV